MRRTRKILAFALSAVFVAASLSACQPTPEKPIVNAGDDTVLNDKIEATAVPTPEGDESLNYGNGFHADQFSCIDEDIGFNVRADVHFPQVKSAPVLGVKPCGITTKFVKDFIDAICPGLTWYEEISFKLTKDKIDEYIKEYQRLLSMPYDEYAREYAESTGITDEESAKYYYEQCKYCLEEYKKLRDSASETYENPPADFSFHPVGYYFENLPEFDYQGVGVTEDDGRRFMQITGCDASGKNCSKIYAATRTDRDIMGEFSYDGSVVFDNGLLTNSGAFDLAKETLIKLGIEDRMSLTEMQFGYEISSVHQGVTSNYTQYFDGPKNGFDPLDVKFDYCRKVNGLTVLGAAESNEYSYTSGMETLSIHITKQGAISITYNNPYEVTETENANVELLSSEEIYSAFKRPASLEFTKSYVSGGNFGIEPIESEIFDSWNAVVTEINFGLALVPIKDGGYRFVPAWQFCGEYSGQKANGETVSTIGTDIVTVFMTINAVDGTRIAGLQ